MEEGCCATGDDVGWSWAIRASGTADWTTGAAGFTGGAAATVGRVVFVAGRSMNAGCRAKGEVLSLRWDRVHLEDAPYATLVRTNTGHQRHVPIPQSIVKTLKALPSHGRHEYLFPSRPTARWPEPQRPYRWDFGKQFRALAKEAGIQNVRIHDLRHAGATILMTLGVPDPIVRKVTGHRSRELERYQHLTPELRALTVNLIATELFRGKRARKERESGTPTGTVRGRRVTENLEGRQRAGTKRDVGGVDGTRAR